MPARPGRVKERDPLAELPLVGGQLAFDFVEGRLDPLAERRAGVVAREEIGQVRCAQVLYALAAIDELLGPLAKVRGGPGAPPYRASIVLKP